MALQFLLQGIPQFSIGMPTTVCVFVFVFTDGFHVGLHVCALLYLSLYLSLHCMHIWYGKVYIVT